MIEALVALLVMGVGVLGVTGLQLVSLQNNQAALMRGEAVQFAYDVMDRIRMNQVDRYAVGMGDDPPNARDCVANTCSMAEMADFDLAIWKCSLGAHNEHGECTDLRDNEIMPPITEQPGLPNGDGSIEINGQVITVTIQWTGFNDQQQELVMNTRV